MTSCWDPLFSSYELFSCWLLMLVAGRKEDCICKLKLKTHTLAFHSGWRPKGLLVAHLHEHKSAVNRIRVSDEHSLFATCSNDGTVKIWNSQKMEGRPPPPGNLYLGGASTHPPTQSLYSLSAHSVAGTVLGTRKTVVINRHKYMFWETLRQWEVTDNKLCVSKQAVFWMVRNVMGKMIAKG